MPCGQAHLLLAAGADVDRRTFNQWTPLHFAAFYGHLAMVRCLLQAGAARDALAGHMSKPALPPAEMAVGAGAAEWSTENKELLYTADMGNEHAAVFEVLTSD